MSDGRHPGWRDSKILAQREKLSTEERLADVYKRLLRAVESRAEQAELTGQGLRETIEAAVRLSEVLVVKQQREAPRIVIEEAPIERATDTAVEAADVGAARVH